MIDLKDVTFIIPIRIDSEDRVFNIQYVISHLLNNFNTNIIIKESGPISRVPDILKGMDVIYQFEKENSNIFHRTRLLNEMLVQVNTLISVNYDIDIFMDPCVYLEAAEKIRNQNYDLVYPYFRGQSQYKISHTSANKYKTENLTSGDYELWQSICGHCQFFKTKSYLKGGMENEHFISWGPEDSERMYRFFKLGYKMIWLDNYIYHIEHARGVNSSEHNPYFKENEDLFRHLWCLTEHQLLDYYNNADYRKEKYPQSYKNIN